MTTNPRVAPITGEDWRALRELRFEMLADTPTAYTETLEDARSLDDDEWRFRAQRCEAPTSLGLAAVDADGRWVGTMSAYVAAPATAFLVGVYIAPAHRGSGLAERMLATVLEWAARQTGLARLLLLVHEENVRAQRFYTRLGFTFTGRTEEYCLDPSAREREMELSLPVPAPVS